MLSKRILVCLYRGVNKQHPGIQYCCYRNQLTRSRSSDVTDCPKVTDKQKIDESKTNDKQGVPISREKFAFLNTVPEDSYLEVKGHTNSEIEKLTANESSLTDYKEKLTNIEIKLKTESSVDNFVTKETSVSSFKEVSSLEVKKEEHTDIDNVVALETSLTDYDNPSSLEIKSENRSDLELHAEPDSSVAPLTENHRELEKYKETSSVPSKAIKRTFEPLFHLARHVNESETLSNLVKLGVSLAEIEKKEGAADIIVKLNFEKDVKPILMFLKDLDIEDSDIGRVITTNPYLFKTDLDDLMVRINYLRSKLFSFDKIRTIVTRNSLVLSMKVERLDACLGFYQKEFKLSGDEVRRTMSKYPRLITCNKFKIKDRKMFIQDVLGFTATEVKTMFVTSPKVFLSRETQFSANFDYLHNVMELSHKDILRWPQIFKTRTHRIEQRHRYLASLGRAQYNPEKENFVSLHDLVSGKDDEFCEKLAKSSYKQYNDFLKML